VYGETGTLVGPVRLELPGVAKSAWSFQIWNVLPLPALDGGRIVVVLLEAIRRRPFDRAKEMAVQRAGLAAILVLAAFIAYFDIQRIVTHQFPGLR